MEKISFNSGGQWNITEDAPLAKSKAPPKADATSMSVYHYSPHKFSEFDDSKHSKGIFGDGHYFMSDGPDKKNVKDWIRHSKDMGSKQKLNEYKVDLKPEHMDKLAVGDEPLHPSFFNKMKRYINEKQKSDPEAAKQLGIMHWIGTHPEEHWSQLGHDPSKEHKPLTHEALHGAMGWEGSNRHSEMGIDPKKAQGHYNNMLEDFGYHGIRMRPIDDITQAPSDRLHSGHEVVYFKSKYIPK